MKIWLKVSTFISSHICNTRAFQEQYFLCDIASGYFFHARIQDKLQLYHLFALVCRLLMHLSMPLEVVMPIVKKLTKEDYEKRDELQKMLATIKKEFTQSTVISCLVGQMALIIEEVSIWFFYDTYSIPTPNMKSD